MHKQQCKLAKLYSFVLKHFTTLGNKIDSNKSVAFSLSSNGTFKMFCYRNSAPFDNNFFLIIFIETKQTYNTRINYLQ